MWVCCNVILIFYMQCGSIFNAVYDSDMKTGKNLRVCLKVLSAKPEETSS